MVASFCQSPIAADPGEEPLDNPASWLNGEADLIGVLAHNLDSDQRGVCDLLTGITAISENALDEWEDAARDAQERSAAIAILDACWVRLEYEATPIRIDECMALASVDLLAGIVAAWSASFCRLHALGIDDCTGRAGLTPRPLTIEHDQGVIDLRETIFITSDRSCSTAASRLAAGATGSQIASHRRFR
jgi:hypothetical protein